MSDKILKKELTIGFDMADLTGKLSVPAAITLAQDIATDHAESIGAGFGSLRRLDSAWVLVRAKYKFYDMPKYGEKITVSTWVNDSRHTFYPRFYRFYREDGSTFMSGGSIWSIYNFKENKAMNPKEANFEFPSIVLENQPEMPRSVRAGEEETTLVRKVLYSDTDGNGHLNNCKYINWILDVLPTDFWKNSRVDSLEISYLSQAIFGEEVTLNYTVTDDGISINGKTAEKTVFAAKAEFAKEE